MIITVDGNPKLVREYFLDELKVGEKNNFHDERVYSAGIGTSCANLIAQSQEEVFLVTYIDRKRGPLYREKLAHRYLYLQEVGIKEEIQEEVFLVEGERRTELSSRLPRITRDEINSLYLAYHENCGKARIVLLPEQEREDLPEDFTAQCVRYAYQKAIPNVVYGKGQDLDKIIDEKPYFLILSKNDLEKRTNLKINFSHEGEKAANVLFDEGVGNVMIVSRETGAILCTKDKCLRLSSEEAIPELNMNYVATGVALGLERKYDLETTLKLAVALGQVEDYFGGKPLDRAMIKSKMNRLKAKEM